jgi:N-acetylneuraminic acid mutarotase
MKFRQNLSSSLSRSETIKCANKSFGISIGVAIWRRFHLLIGLVLCSAGVLLPFAGLSKSVADLVGNRVLKTGVVRHEAKAPTPGMWTATGSMSTGHKVATATLLTNGKVLVAGGDDTSNNPTAIAELYDPSTGVWAATGSMTIPREDHTATLLPDGTVLVVGGRVEFCLTTSSAELYDPGTGTWSTTGAMQSSRSRHFATLITSGPLAGKVLAAGGYINSNDGACGGAAQLASAEVYDPITGLWSPTNDMTMARQSPLGVTLPDASVLAIGVLNCCPYTWFNSAESYDPSTQSWTPKTVRFTPANGAAVLLQNGKLLVAGGTKGTQPTAVNVASAELFDSSTGTWTVTGSMSTDRSGHTLTLLASGQILVAGGFSGGWGVCNDLTGAELYDSSAGAWSLTGNMTTARFGHTATILPNGQVLVAGGQDCAGDVRSSAELYTPTTTLAGRNGGAIGVLYFRVALANISVVQ